MCSGRSELGVTAPGAKRRQPYTSETLMCQSIALNYHDKGGFSCNCADRRKLSFRPPLGRQSDAVCNEPATAEQLDPNLLCTQRAQWYRRGSVEGGLHVMIYEGEMSDEGNARYPRQPAVRPWAQTGGGLEVVVIGGGDSTRDDMGDHGVSCDALAPK
jgi:hypothetical protein